MGVATHRSTLVATAINELTQMIFTGSLKPGDFLPPQRVLAEQLGVGASTIREAIQVLISMGIVESRPGKGTWVCTNPYPPASYVDSLRLRLGELKASMVFEARLVMEVPMTEYAAERATPEELAAIQAALDAMEGSSSEDGSFARADFAFHYSIAKASHNDLLIQFYHLASGLLFDVIEELDKLPGVKEEAIAAHRSVAQAVAARDGRRARESALDHLVRVGRLIRRFA